MPTSTVCTPSLFRHSLPSHSCQEPQCSLWPGPVCDPPAGGGLSLGVQPLSLVATTISCPATSSLALAATYSTTSLVGGGEVFWVLAHGPYGSHSPCCFLPGPLPLSTSTFFTHSQGLLQHTQQQIWPPRSLPVIGLSDPAGLSACKTQPSFLELQAVTALLCPTAPFMWACWTLIDCSPQPLRLAAFNSSSAVWGRCPITDAYQKNQSNLLACSVLEH